MGLLGKFLSDIQMIIGGITVCALGIFSFAFLKSVEMGADNSVVHYAIGIFLIYGVGYPVGHTAVIGLFSKGKSPDIESTVFSNLYVCSQLMLHLLDCTVVGRRPQGTLQGWFASAGSLARIIFPVMAGYISQYDDITTVFILLCVVLIISNIFVAMSSKTLAALSI